MAQNRIDAELSDNLYLLFMSVYCPPQKSLGHALHFVVTSS